MAFGPQTRGGPAKVKTPEVELESGPAIPETREVSPVLDEEPPTTTTPMDIQAAVPAGLRSPMLGEGDLEQAGVDEMPKGFKDDLDGIADALGSVGRASMKQPKFESPIPPQYQELRTVLDDLRSSMDRRGSISGMTMPEKLEDPLGPFIGAGKFEDFTNKVAEAVKPYATDRRPKPPTVPTEPPKRSSRDDDDGPNLAQQMQERMKAEREEKEAAAKQEAANIRESAKAIESSGVDLGGKTAIQQVGLNRSKDDEDPDANDPRRGMMKSGGLASRKNKKK